MQGDTRRETLLIVEDEPAVRRLMEAALGDRFSLLFAPSAEEAEPLFHAHPEVDLLLCDELLPNERGSRLAARLLAERPDLKVVLASGYPEELLQSDLMTRQSIVFIGKPFELQGLRRTIEGLLDRA